MNKTTLSGKMPKRKILADILSSLLLIFFVHTVISSYVNFASLENLLGVFYTHHSTKVSWTIIIIEFLIVILLFIPRTRIVGLAFTILFAFSAIFTIVRTPHFPHDFGGIANYISHIQRLLLYVLVALFAMISIAISIKKRNVRMINERNPVVFT